MLTTKTHFEILARIRLFDPSKGRESFINDGYRPNIYFGISDPNDSNSSSDCIIKLINKKEVYPGESTIVLIYVVRFHILRGLLTENNKLKIKEGARFIGDGEILRVIGERDDKLFAL